MTRWCRLNDECRSAVLCAQPMTRNGRYPCADPQAHRFEVADKHRPEDGCRHCGYLERSHTDHMTPDRITAPGRTEEAS